MTSDLFTAAQEMAEERAAILEFDGLMTREDAGRFGKLYAEEWRHACEVRHVLSMRSPEARRDYLDAVERMRGKESADHLRQAVSREWVARREALGGQA